MEEEDMSSGSPSVRNRRGSLSTTTKRSLLKKFAKRQEYPSPSSSSKSNSLLLEARERWLAKTAGDENSKERVHSINNGGTESPQSEGATRERSTSTSSIGEVVKSHKSSDLESHLERESNRSQRKHPHTEKQHRRSKSMVTKALKLSLGSPFTRFKSKKKDKSKNKGESETNAEANHPDSSIENYSADTLKAEKSELAFDVDRGRRSSLVPSEDNEPAEILLTKKPKKSVNNQEQVEENDKLDSQNTMSESGIEVETQTDLSKQDLTTTESPTNQQKNTKRNARPQNKLKPLNLNKIL
eukprot:TRINITY_DN6072_c0_g2_i1.p1 TRINITY_DN6072_c0_g2~~TRINITY_DN6072_c0_g2_i1.p1  ORF type:complete len:314 (+),score=72.07 TRINITY_DN6072_c0_g2_i1:48-944(+)